MFSTSEKQHIAKVIEDTIASLNHPEMDNDNIRFTLMVNGRESWSFATITDNKSTPFPNNPNPWNEVAREYLENIPQHD